MWHYNDKPLTEVPEGAIGFVYRITNLSNGMQYIGKKNFYAAKTSVRTVTVKTGANAGTKKKKKLRSKVESDWQTYFGSSEFLKAEVERLGEETFKREIIRLCSSKGELSYFEAYHQFNEHVLLHPDKYYNGWISVRVRGSHLTALTKPSTPAKRARKAKGD